MISILLEIITIAMPIGFQLVIDEVVVAADFDLLSLIALGLGLLLVMQVLATLARSWATMLFGGHLVLQWKVSLFDQLMRLPLEFSRSAMSATSFRASVRSIPSSGR